MDFLAGVRERRLAMLAQGAETRYRAKPRDRVSGRLAVAPAARARSLGASIASALTAQISSTPSRF
jgi:hypothetical protein